MSTDCPCCSDRMLRHFRSHQVYWFCRSCWQEMPALNSHQTKLFSLATAIGISNQEAKLHLIKNYS